MLPFSAVMPEMLEGRYTRARMVAVEDNMRPLLAVQCHAALVHQVAAGRDRPDGLAIGGGNGQLIGLVVGGPPAQAVIVGFGVSHVDIVDALFRAQGMGPPDKAQVQAAILPHHRIVPVGVGRPRLLVRATQDRLGVVPPLLLRFIIGLDVRCAVVVGAVAIEQGQRKALPGQDECRVGHPFLVLPGHGQLVRPLANVVRLQATAIFQLGGVMVIADVQVAFSIHAQADAVVGIFQVVLPGQVVHF